MKLSKREQLMSFVGGDFLFPSDVIVVLEGDFYYRADRAIELFESKYADKIIISGGLEGDSIGSFHGEKLKKYILDKCSIKPKNIILEVESLYTRAQAINVMRLIKENNWQSIILIASHFHQYRAYLTFLRAMQEAELEILIFNAPARNIPWFEIELPKIRLELLDMEFQKIKEYSNKGHIVSFDDAINYQIWKEKKIKSLT
ncbi:MAG: YdcF family protein [Candidatus Niyogibacteria bacterium]|nr:YdcF family protein [Candidatus Niyogibacteria bacterium]